MAIAPSARYAKVVMLWQRPVNRALRRSAVAGVAAGALIATACDWVELDAVRAIAAAPDVQAPSFEDASIGAGEAAPPPSAPDVGPPDAAVMPLACNNNQAPINQWTFDSNTNKWTLFTDTGVDASLVWVADAGDPSAGALEVDVAPDIADGGGIKGAWAQYDMPLGDLTGRTVSAWVWLDNGTAPHLKLYVQTGSQYVWADNGTIFLSPHRWTCLSLPVSSPGYNGAHYDPTSVVRVGVEMLGSEPFRLYLDTVRY